MKKSRYICKRCNNTIQKTTYIKYGGYSNYCLRQTRLDEKHNPTIEESEIVFHLTKTNIRFPKIYYKKEFSFIYGINTKTDQEKYYTKYLNKLEKLIEVEI